MPTVGPDLDSLILKLCAILDNIWNTNAGMHQVLGDRNLIVRRIGKLEEMFVVGKVHEGEFIALGGLFLLPKYKTNFFVKLD